MLKFPPLIFNGIPFYFYIIYVIIYFRYADLKYLHCLIYVVI